jgi:hypothetical protein
MNVFINSTDREIIGNQLHSGLGQLWNIFNSDTLESPCEILARLPLVILGHIHRFSTSTEVGGSRFAGTRKSSYSFLFVRHRRPQVARRFLELWNHWGKSLEDRRHLRSGTSSARFCTEQGGEPNWVFRRNSMGSDEGLRWVECRSGGYPG